MKTPAIIGITPFETPDVALALALSAAKAFPVLHLGRNKAFAIAALEELSQKCGQNFGVCFVSSAFSDIPLPPQVTLVIAPYGMKIPGRKNVQVFYQVHNLQEALKAKAGNADGIIIKGNESAGKVGDESAFILLQHVIKAIPDTNIWVQGGAGIHTTAAMLAIGAKGVILDSQLVLFPECKAPAAIKNVCEKLNGNETRVIDNYRVLVRPNSPALPENARLHDLESYLGPLELENGYLPLGQDIALSIDLVQRYKKLGRLITGIHEAARGHLHQAKTLDVISPGNALAKELNIPYPIAQGPMTRVSDVPAFAESVANAGALPFVALSLLKGEPARQLIQQTKKLVQDKTWGVGILGFAPQELRDEQIAYIKEEKPPIVLIAGGRPSQAKALEQMGIKTFLHVPSTSLLDMFIKEGANRFVFEGRECGGHVGPLSSMVLWEKQINRLLQEDNAAQLNVFFAGGIHDALSTAFIAVMTASLATKGAKIGVLMGTAYIYTREAVETGAILQQFQDQAITHTNTVLLETAPGHETRCLHSPFANFFNEEKKKLSALLPDKKELWSQLEQLNVGRLRIAAKGVDRKDDQLLAADNRQQLQEGMYMIGQVAALRHKIVAMKTLHKDVAINNFRYVQEAPLPEAQQAPEKALDVAIIGMACIYPGAKNIEEYWSNIISGKDCVTEVPDERWNKALYYDPASLDGNKTPSKWGGFIPKIDFDPVAFGIPPQSLAAIDPTQLLSLLVAKQALENAGYGNNDFNGEDVSVIIGAEGGNDLANNYGFRSLFRQIFGEMPEALDNALPKLTEDSFPGVLANVISGRITNRLNLGGRNYTVDAACASSLAAVDLACQELILEKADMVLAGAADLHNGINDYLMFSSTHALSKTGKCMTFDAAADGIALGEGVAMLVLKRHADAQRDGNRIYAVIKGVGGSSDGKSLGLTAPRKAGQVKALERAYEQSGVSPSALGLVEAHGTGTVVGDKTELSAISDMLIQSGAIAGQTHLGSVKTQIGHTKCAAGLAGLIKAALSVYHGVKPPTLHIKNPNSYYNETTSPFLFNTEAGVWLDKKRLAGISAFGFGGTNFHVVVENDSNREDTAPVVKTWPAELFVFRGDVYEDALQCLQQVRTILENNDNIALKDLAYSLACYSTQPVLLSIVAGSREDLLLKLDLALSGATAKEIYPVQKQEGKVAFLFPGQGSQRVNMARELFVAFPVMRKLLKRNPAYEKILYPSAVFNENAVKKQQEQIKDTRAAQPLLGMVDLAIASFLKELGIQPDMVAGHSYGELPALCFANVFAEEQLVPLSEKRAKAILDATGEDKGMMIALNCTAAQLADIATTGVYPVNHNSPLQWVLAGSTPAITQLMEELRTLKISYKQMEVACAFHSPLIAASKALYKTAISEVAFSTPAIPVWSNTTATEYPVNPDDIKELLTDHLVQPVHFCEEITQMYAQGARIFIEAGPGKVLSGLTKAIIGKDALVLHTEDKGAPAIIHLLSTIAQYIAAGKEVLLEKLFEGRDVQQLQLDTPDLYKKSSTTWYVNGQLSVPAVGKLPAHGALPIVTPLQLRGSEIKVTANGNAEHMVQEYLNSVKHLVQAQRDVILGYLGHTHQTFNRVETPVVPARNETPAHVHIHAAISSNGTPGNKDTRKILIEVVSDKTGYPPEMLGMDMDLEADLSIDSIKRMEIIGELRTQMGGFKNTGKSEETVVEQLAGIKTLSGLLQWIADNVDQPVTEPGGTSLQHALAQQAAPAQAVTQTTTALSRLRFVLTPAPFRQSAPESLAGRQFAIVDDGSNIVGLIKTTLEQHGASAHIITENDALENYNGLIIPDIISSPQRPDLLSAFALIKKLDPEKAKWVYAISVADDADEQHLQQFQGYPGFLKSLDKEWEHTKCRSIRLSAKLNGDTIAGIITEEILNPDLPSAIVYHDTNRLTAEMLPSPLTTGDASGIQMDKKSVVLVLGGAQGITSALMIRFAKDYPCHYILVGRSADPRAEGNNKYAAFQHKEDIKKQLIAEGQYNKPAEIEQKAAAIHKCNQIVHTIETLEAQGATVTYQPLDLRNEAALSQFIEQVYKDYGRIDGVIHGAGLLEDKLFHQKTADSFERVFATKVTPLRVLAAQLRADTQFIVLFSSVASVYGNRGQTDYAAANSVLDHYAGELKKNLSGKVVAINWGPWKGAGMVSPSLEKEYARRGISLIPLQAGMEAFVNELKYGNENQVLIMAE